MTSRRRLGSLVLFSGLATVLGFGTQLLTAFYFGTSRALDDYLLALAVVTALAFYVHPFREALVSVVFRAVHKGERQMNEVLSAGIITVFALAVLATLLLFLLLEAGALASSTFATAQVRTLLYTLLPFGVLFALSETINAVMLSLDLVATQAAARVASAAVVALTVGALGGVLGVQAMVLSVLAGQLVVLAISWTVLRKHGVRFKFVRPLQFYDRAFYQMFGALLVNFILSQSYVLLERFTIGSFETGALSAFQYATLFANVLLTVFAFPLANLLWSQFLQLAGTGEPAKVTALAREMAPPVAFLILALAVFTWYSASSIVQWLYSRGSFDEHSFRLTVDAMRMTIFAIVPVVLVTVALRALMSLGRSRQVAAVGILMAIIGVAVLLVATAYESLRFAQAHWLIANTAGAAASWLMLSRETGPLRLPALRTMSWQVIRAVAAVLLPLLVLARFPVQQEGWSGLTLHLGATSLTYAGLVAALMVATRLLTHAQLRALASLR